ncbi:hypothetical protein F3Y22_tig00011824pilonHSYRG00046 [Hibiscus syriacus]|uniref:DNA 3'-5' helicase n=1 Tax=Hibiscus syriacus TaxID=106335 RepID=A0A6A3C966_HIBSY|nr:hypothetical protein F3Y22_tig00011824pilonHSYRG00046 [Hibiscus syriacus]
MLARKPEMKSSAGASVRFLAVSATIPNMEDLDILMQYSRGKSALVFCSTRKGAQEAAQRLSQVVMNFGHSNPFIKSHEQRERLREASLSCGDKQMQSYILYGVGYHNGGLSLKDRNIIEGLFLSADVQVLCTTNTLAHGINLPAHTVVIKSTQHFNKEKGLYMEYDRSMVLQMCGRACRAPFDDTGMVIIMTRRETVHLYENLLNGCEMVESQPSFNLLDEEPGEGMELSCDLHHIVLDPLPESTEPEQITDRINNYLTRKCHVIAGSSITIDITEDSGDLRPEPKTFSFERLTEETIFDHIRKKSKNFPVTNTPKVIEYDCFIRAEAHNSENQPGFGSATLCTSKDAMVISKLEHKEANVDPGGTISTNVKNITFNGSSPGANGESASSIKMLSFDISMVKNNSKHPADLGSSTEDGRSDSKRQRCSFTSTGQAREVDLFLGFQSVFSFL